MNYERIFTGIGVAAVILLLFGLGGWYLFLRSETAAIENAADARGFSIGIPSFLGTRGSTAENAGGGSQEFTNGSGSSPFAQLLGFGQRLAEEAAPNESTAGTREEPKAPRFWRVTSAPVAGAAFTAGSSTRLRYVERATGHVFDANPQTGEVTRVTNTLTPRVYEAMIGGTFVVERIVEEGVPATLSGMIGTTSVNGAAELATVSLGKDIRDIVATPSDIVFITSSQTSNRLVRAKWDGSTPKQLLTLPGGDFRLSSAGKDIILVERAGSGIPGNAYRVASSLVPLIRAVPGLTLQAQGESGNILFSSDDGTNVALFAKLGTAAAVALPSVTTAEKCVWAPRGALAYCAVPQGTLPTEFHDRWYRGEVHTEDVWYVLDTAAVKTNVLFRIDQGSAIDVENPRIDNAGNYIAFQNARDKSLWMLRIAE